MADKSSKTICLYVNDEIQTFLRWSIREYTKNINIAHCRKTDKIDKVLGSKKIHILFIDLPPQNESVASYLKKIMDDNPAINILLIVPPTINRDEAMQVIRGKLVKGILVQPFSAEVVCNYINKINC
jgi:hypothetical protein